MIESIDIARLRGISNGRLEELGNVTLLTGLNGCGKTTILEAIHIASSSSPARAVAQVVGRRRTNFGARWLVESGSHTAEIRIGEDRSVRTYRLEHQSAQGLGGPDYSFAISDRIFIKFGTGENPSEFLGPSTIVFGSSNQFAVENDVLAENDRDSQLLDPRDSRPLEEAFSRVVRAGKRQLIEDALRQLLPGYSGLQILTEDDQTSALYLEATSGHAVPIGVAGDGVSAFVQFAIELASMDEQVVLLEEPEAFQHPRALRQTAATIWAAVGRGAQVVIATHSLELIDMLIEGRSSEDGSLVLFNLALQDGTLATARYSQEDIVLARGEWERDLR